MTFRPLPFFPLQVTYTSPRSAQKLEQLYPQADVFVRGYGEPGALLLATQARLDVPAAAPALHQAGVHLAGRPDAGAMAQVQLQVRCVIGWSSLPVRELWSDLPPCCNLPRRTWRVRC